MCPSNVPRMSLLCLSYVPPMSPDPNPAFRQDRRGRFSRPIAPHRRCNLPTSSPSSLLLASLEFSDTKVFQSGLRALPGTASYCCEMVVVKSRTLPISQTPNRAQTPRDSHFSKSLISLSYVEHLATTELVCRFNQPVFNDVKEAKPHRLPRP